MPIFTHLRPTTQQANVVRAEREVTCARRTMARASHRWKCSDSTEIRWQHKIPFAHSKNVFFSSKYHISSQINAFESSLNRVNVDILDHTNGARVFQQYFTLQYIMKNVRASEYSKLKAFYFVAALADRNASHALRNQHQ